MVNAACKQGYAEVQLDEGARPVHLPSAVSAAFQQIVDMLAFTVLPFSNLKKKTKLARI